MINSSNNSCRFIDASSRQVTISPCDAIVSFSLMDQVVDSIRVSNEKGFKSKNPITSHLQNSRISSTQFYLYIYVCSWLRHGHHAARVTSATWCSRELDSFSTILDHVVLRVPLRWPRGPPKKRKWSHVTFVVGGLVSLSSNKVIFNFEMPTDVEESGHFDYSTVVNNNRIHLRFFQGKKFATYRHLFDQSDDVQILLDLQKLCNRDSEAWPDEILHSTTTSEEWRLELERALPQLKVTIRPDNRDWRSHVEQMHDHRSKIDETLNFTQKQLDNLHNEITRSLEKIGSREKYLNSQLEPLLHEYRNLQNVAAESREQYRQVSGRLVEKSHILAQISDELDRVKHEMEEKGSSMTDGSPLVNIRKGVTRVRQEIVAMDVRIGVVEQKLLQAKLKDKSNMQRDMNAPVYNNMDLGLF
ncbi:unnamed protein product, partial [Meganyctiphanes norvegica]